MNKKSRIEIEESVNLSNNSVVQIIGVNDSQFGYGISIKGGGFFSNFRRP